MEIARKIVSLQKELQDLGALSFTCSKFDGALVHMYGGTSNNLGLDLKIESFDCDTKPYKVIAKSNGVTFVELANKEDINNYFPQLKEAIR